MTLIARASTVLLLLGGFVAATPAPSFGVAFLVTRTDDPAPDGCAPGDCSLREAILDANTLAGPDTVTLPAGIHTLSIPPNGTPDSEEGDLDVGEELTITGAGAQATVIDGGDVDRVFEIIGVSVLISDVTIRNGKTSDINGTGGIRVLGDLTLERVAVTGNEATAGSGGGIVVTSSSASVTILRDHRGGVRIQGERSQSPELVELTRLDRPDLDVQDPMLRSKQCHPRDQCWSR